MICGGAGGKSVACDCYDLILSRCINAKRKFNPLVELEASGNVTAATIRPIAESGVDFISVGAITHTVAALDIHLVLV